MLCDSSRAFGYTMYKEEKPSGDISIKRRRLKSIDKLKIVENYKMKSLSVKTIGESHGVNQRRVQTIVKRYNEDGIENFLREDELARKQVSFEELCKIIKITLRTQQMNILLLHYHVSSRNNYCINVPVAQIYKAAK